MLASITKANKVGLICLLTNRPFSYSYKESESNDICVNFVKLSNVNNRDLPLKPLNRTLRIIMYKTSLDPDFF